MQLPVLTIYAGLDDGHRDIGGLILTGILGSDLWRPAIWPVIRRLDGVNGDGFLLDGRLPGKIRLVRRSIVGVRGRLGLGGFFRRFGLCARGRFGIVDGKGRNDELGFDRADARLQHLAPLPYGLVVELRIVGDASFQRGVHGTIDFLAEAAIARIALFERAPDRLFDRIQFRFLASPPTWLAGRVGAINSGAVFSAQRAGRGPVARGCMERRDAVAAKPHSARSDLYGNVNNPPGESVHGLA
ncbi:hypothetical protein [Aquibium oceanicum]|uniref:hypothetical protein n=1 Tax=Aquibium oceanicum TaxID=1670800 RepID=UPI0012FFAA2C|nr:hypothetical protein [Aquibium oceanicum]